MAAVLLGAGVMLVGIIIGYALSNSSRTDTEEVAKWTQEIDDVPGTRK